MTDQTLPMPQEEERTESLNEDELESVVGGGARHTDGYGDL